MPLLVRVGAFYFTLGMGFRQFVTPICQFVGKRFVVLLLSTIFAVLNLYIQR